MDNRVRYAQKEQKEEVYLRKQKTIKIQYFNKFNVIL